MRGADKELLVVVDLSCLSRVRRVGSWMRLPSKFVRRRFNHFVRREISLSLSPFEKKIERESEIGRRKKFSVGTTNLCGDDERSTGTK